MNDDMMDKHIRSRVKEDLEDLGIQKNPRTNTKSFIYGTLLLSLDEVCHIVMDYRRAWGLEEYPALEVKRALRRLLL